MKSGETRFIVKKLDLKDEDYNSVAFRLSNGKTTIKKSTDAESDKDKVLVQDGVFLIPLQQTDTQALEGNVTLEAQINYENHSVRKSDDNFMFVGSTLGTDFVQGSEPAQDDGIEVVMTAIEEGVAVIVNPEASQELIDAVTRLFQDTKQIAQSVRDDADAGEFDGYSPQVTVKTETPTTYVLHIKDAEHEFDTPNLQGQGGEGSLEVGDGLKRVGNVVSVNNGEFLYFSNGKLTINPVSLGGSKLRQDLADTAITTQYKPLATREYVDNLISTSLKRLVVEQLPQNPNTYTIYMVLRQAPTTNNIYDEYMYINNAWELIGSTEVDLSNYYTKTESDNRYQNKLTVGNGVDITSDTISVKINGRFLTFANNGLTINTNVLGSSYALRQELANGDSTTFALASKSNLADYQPKLTAGTNITIDSNNVISASGGGLSYTFTDGLKESSGTVGIDLASGSKLLIDANDKLDVDLSSYVKNTDYATSSVAGVLKSGSNWFRVSSQNGVPVCDVRTYQQYLDVSSDNVFISKGTLENVITGKQLVNQTDLSSKQDTIDSTHKLSADLVDDTSATNKFVTSSDITAWNGKQDEIDSSHKLSSDLVDDTNNTNLFVTSSEKSTWNGKADNTVISTDTTSTTVSLTLADNHEYRYTQDLTSLTLTMPNGDFISSIVFASGSTPTSMTYDSSIKWSGDDVTSNAFVPVASKTYNVVMWYDGINVNGVVRGV